MWVVSSFSAHLLERKSMVSAFHTAVWTRGEEEWQQWLNIGDFWKEFSISKEVGFFLRSLSLNKGYKLTREASKTLNFTIELDSCFLNVRYMLFFFKKNSFYVYCCSLVSFQSSEDNLSCQDNWCILWITPTNTNKSLVCWQHSSSIWIVNSDSCRAFCSERDTVSQLHKKHGCVCWTE